MPLALNFPLSWLGEGLLYAAAINSFKDLIRPQKKCLTGIFLLLSLGVLIYAHSVCDFSFLTVVEHNHTHQPLLYRIAAVWGNHEGSMLLWVTQLSLYQILACRLLPIELRQPVQTILSCLLLVFIIFMLAACNPFLSILSSPLQGEGLNPALQDPSLMIHPPCLYAGYTGLVIPFVLSLTAIIQKQLTPTCIKAMSQWTAVAWTWLTLGLSLGSFWAYYELGWGGWWYWDPVETISLLPWLTTTVLLHTLRAGLKKSTVKLALAGFLFSVMILFFVRSGLLTSVHSFTVDTERGVLLFSILGMITFAVLYIWFKNRNAFLSHSFKVEFSFRNLIFFQNIYVWIAIATLLLAIAYPLFAEQWEQNISISPFYFQATFIPLSLPLLLSMGLGPWAAKSFKGVLSTLAPTFTVTLVVWLGLFWWAHTIPLFGLIILSISAWIIISHLYALVISGFKKPGMYLAHVGLGIAIIGMVVSTYGTQQTTLILTLADKPLSVAGWQISLQQINTHPGPNYTARQAILNVYNDQDQLVTTLKPERRYFTAAKVIHTEVAFYNMGLSHLYMVLLNDDKEPYSIQADYKPCINLLWLGVLMMVMGGGLTVVKRWRRLS